MSIRKSIRKSTGKRKNSGTVERLKKAKTSVSLSFPKHLFQVGFEFETRDSIGTTDKIVEKMSEKIKGSDNVTKSLEFIEPYKYRDFPMKPEADINLFNVEYQFGVFDNLTFDQSIFEKEFDILKGQIKSIVDTKNINVNGKDYGVSFIDTHKKCFTDPDDTGVIQMTTTFQLRFLPNLFRLMSTFISLSPLDFFNGFIYTTSYNETLYLLNSSGVEKDDTLFGFMLYIVYYWKITFETKLDKRTYFKAFFPIKPRTNLATLYENMSPSNKLNIVEICKHLIARPRQLKIMQKIQKINKNIYLFFVLKTLHSLIYPPEPKHYYIKNLPEISDGFYHLEGCTEEMIKAVPGVVIEKKPFYMCELDLYTYNIDLDHVDDLGALDCKEHDNKLVFDGNKYVGTPFEVCEWPAVGDNISMEFRIWSEIVCVTERIAKEENDMENYEKLSDILYKERLTIDDFEVCTRLLFKYFIPRIFKEEPNPFVEISFLTKSKLDIKIDGVTYTKSLYYNYLIDKYKNLRNISGKPIGILSIDDFIEKLNDGSTSIKELLESDKMDFRAKSLKKSQKKSQKKSLKKFQKKFQKKSQKKSLKKFQKKFQKKSLKKSQKKSLKKK
jgi:hypothetical protein